MNFNEVFRKDVACDNVKSHEKSRFYALCRKHTCGSQGVNFMPAFFGLI